MPAIEFRNDPNGERRVFTDGQIKTVLESRLPEIVKGLDKTPAVKKLLLAIAWAITDKSEEEGRACSTCVQESLVQYGISGNRTTTSRKRSGLMRYIQNHLSIDASHVLQYERGGVYRMATDVAEIIRQAAEETGHRFNTSSQLQGMTRQNASSATSTVISPQERGPALSSESEFLTLKLPPHMSLEDGKKMLDFIHATANMPKGEEHQLTMEALAGRRMEIRIQGKKQRNEEP